MTLAELNAASRERFIDAVGFVFEHSTWIAAATWPARPFASVESLHASMLAILDEAPLEDRVALIAAHPDLAGKLAREGSLTSASHGEQHAAGLDVLTPEEIARFDALNSAYRTRFGFPFVICAREHDKQSILAHLEARLVNDRAAEIAAAIAEIGKIARLRLRDAVVES